MFKFSQRSLSNLQDVHVDLQKVATRALELTQVDFVVIEGKRSYARQQKLFNQGATRTMNSRHLTGHAIDLAAWVDGTVRWDWPLYEQIGRAMKEAAQELNIPLKWGGDWLSFKDGPHFELDRRHYP